MRYILEMNEEQAGIVQKALEFYSRMRMGQWEELIWRCLNADHEHYHEKREYMSALLELARRQCYPDLPHTLMGASYGVGKFADADLAWEVYESIRHCVAWAKHPEGGWTVDFDKPRSFRGNEIAKCTAVEDKKDE